MLTTNTPTIYRLSAVEHGRPKDPEKDAKWGSGVHLSTILQECIRETVAVTERQRLVVHGEDKR